MARAAPVLPLIGVGAHVYENMSVLKRFFAGRETVKNITPQFEPYLLTRFQNLDDRSKSITKSVT